ncbi:MAG: peptidase M54 [Acidobacteriota bacterium]
MSSHVHLWWLGADAPDSRLLDTVGGAIRMAFHVTVRIERRPDRPTQAFDPKRGQHSSTQILKWLVARAPAGTRTLAVTDVDLFIPVLTFVYGEAQLGGAAAVVSTARLALGAGPDVAGALFDSRVIKESLHELGHTFGLLHCDTRDCVMARSVNLVEVDAKRATLCADCDARYRALHPKELHHE